MSRPQSGEASPNARAVAAQLLDRIEGDGAFANLVLASAKLPERDAGFITELVYGVTRMRRALDHLIDGFVSDPPDLTTRNLLRIGAYQLHMMDTPAYAAVSETVGAASRRQRDSSTPSCGGWLTWRQLGLPRRSDSAIQTGSLNSWNLISVPAMLSAHWNT